MGRCHWGQGFATEAAEAVVRMGFQAQGYERLTSRYHADNPASGRVLIKLGFKPVGLSNHPCLAEGKDKPSSEMQRSPRASAESCHANDGAVPNHSYRCQP